MKRLRRVGGGKKGRDKDNKNNKERQSRGVFRGGGGGGGGKEEEEEEEEESMRTPINAVHPKKTSYEFYCQSATELASWGE